MPHMPAANGGGSSADGILFPVDQMREVAAKILVQADLALEKHTMLWAQVQAFLHEHDEGGHMAAVLNPHEQRMRASYNWQIQLASTLFQAIDTVEGTDNAMAQDFMPGGHHGQVP